MQQKKGRPRKSPSNIIIGLMNAVFQQRATARVITTSKTESLLCNWRNMLSECSVNSTKNCNLWSLRICFNYEWLQNLGAQTKNLEYLPKQIKIQIGVVQKTLKQKAFTIRDELPQGSVQSKKQFVSFCPNKPWRKWQ